MDNLKVKSNKSELIWQKKMKRMVCDMKIDKFSYDDRSEFEQLLNKQLSELA